jgi:hypothetical protein
MKRHRTRIDWPQRVYVYHCDDVVIPQAAWDLLHQRQALWNDLAVLGTITAGQAKAEPDLKSIHWWCFDFNAKELIRRSGLDWVNGPDVLDRYRASVNMTLKKWRRGDLSARFPQPHGGLRSVRLLHRYTGGGVPVPMLFNSGRQWRCRLAQPIDGHGHVDGSFGMDGGAQAIDFRAVIPTPHNGAGRPRSSTRRLPIERAVLKRVAFCGCRNIFGWRWSLQLTVEEPPVVFDDRPVEKLVAGLDLGWRKCGDHIRIGMLVDSHGQAVELRWPFAAPGRSRHNGTDWREIDDVWAPQISFALMEAKAAALPLLSRRPAPQVWERTGASGLRRILRECGENDAVRPVLSAWEAKDTALRRRQQGMRTHLARYRTWIYRQIAQWLCRRYGIIAWESDLDLKGLAEQTTDSAAIEAGKRWRQMVGLSELREYQKQRAARDGTQMVGVAAHTTDRCAECGAVVALGPQLALTCANGHTRDQDVNAALRLLSQTGASSVQIEDLRKRRAQYVAEDLGIPDCLQAVAVPCSLG